MMKAGEYYIGDLCYVMHDEWDEVCNLKFPKNTNGRGIDGEFTLKSGVKFAVYSTMHGDGYYYDGNMNGYGVDAGVIGCILVSDIDPSNKDNMIPLGHIHYFDKDFETSESEGIIKFGNVIINTDWEDDDYEEEIVEEIEENDQDED